ncbi:MAG: hypothetical protein RXN91_09270 [Caldivirga sp.]
MVSAESSFLSITPGLRCRDESGRIVLWARVHGDGYLYASIGLNGGCSILARKLVRCRVLVTVGINGDVIDFAAKVKARIRTSIGIAIPLRYRGLFNRGDVVEVMLRQIEGDGHG